jgi:hypothetical protein
MVRPSRGIEWLGRPWAVHPLARQMAEGLLTHYARLRDIQTLALLSCLLSAPPFSVSEESRGRLLVTRN